MHSPDYLPNLYDRPRRSECIGGPRPCPLVGCRYNNYLRVTNSGQIRFNVWKEPEDVPADKSCCLDLADHGPQTLETIGEIVGLTRERIRQIENAGLAKIVQTVGEKEIRIWRGSLSSP